MIAKAVIIVALVIAAGGLSFAVITALSFFLGGALFVTSTRPAVEAMLQLADLRPGDKVYDLGCGDGRLLVTAGRRCPIRATGVEISPIVLGLAWLRARMGGVPVRLIRGNVLKTDFSDADVVFCYLMPDLLARMDAGFQALKPGSRIVCHRFGLPGWSPGKIIVLPGRWLQDRVLLYRR
jgi:SAM-dependent methyltransferase